MERLWANQSGAVSVQALQELYVTITQKVTTPIAPHRAVEIVEGLERMDCARAEGVRHRSGGSALDALSDLVLGCFDRPVGSRNELEGDLDRRPSARAEDRLGRDSESFRVNHRGENA